MSRVGKTSLPLSLLIGALLVPLAAVASVVIVEPGQPTVAEASPEPATATVATGATVGAPSLGEDLAMACGPAGQDLVAHERDGTATQIQRAALDALRPICDAVGLSLPAVGDNDAASIQSPAVVPVSSVEASSTAVGGSNDDHEHDDDHDHKEDDHEDDHEEDDDGEWEDD